MIRNIDVDQVRERRFRIAVDYAFSSAALVMPALLRRLRVESFSVHSFMDPDEEAIRTADLPAFTSQTRRMVEAMGADLGVVLDRSAERIILIDDRAREIPADTTLHLMLRLLSRHSKNGVASCCRQTPRWSPARWWSGRDSRSSTAGSARPR